MTDNDNDVMQLMEIANLDSADAKALLKACEGRLETAIDLAFSGVSISELVSSSTNQQGAESTAAPAGPTAPSIEEVPDSAPVSVQSLGGPIDVDSLDAAGQVLDDDDSDAMDIDHGPQGTLNRLLGSGIQISDSRQPIGFGGAGVGQGLDVGIGIGSGGVRNFGVASGLLDPMSAALHASAGSRQGSSSTNSVPAELAAPELALQGSLDDVCEEAQDSNCWLLVNVIDHQDFNTLQVNRDIWKDSSVLQSLFEGFMLWQVYHDSPRGSSYSERYPADSKCTLDVLDPITKARVAHIEHLNTIQAANLSVFLARFVRANPPISSTVKLPSVEGVHAQDSQGAHVKASMSQAAESQSASLMDEDEALQRALQESMASASQGTLQSFAMSAPVSQTGGHAMDGDAGSSAGGMSDYEKVLRARAAGATNISDATIENMSIRKEIDEEYEEALRKDRQAAAKQQQEEEAQRAAQAQAQAAEQEAQARLASMQQQLPEEPKTGDGNLVTIAIRLPSGKRITRKFLDTHCAKHIYMFMELQGFRTDSHQLVHGMPSKVTLPNSDAMLKDCEIGKMCLLTVENI